jgi:hypothetical protein
MEVVFSTHTITNFFIHTVPNDSYCFWADLHLEGHVLTHGQWTSRESFFSKIWNFWAWADKLGWNFGGHFGYFQPNYRHYFGTVSPLFMGKCSWIIFLQFLSSPYSNTFRQPWVLLWQFSPWNTACITLFLKYTS